jgi:hypothetical protein
MSTARMIKESSKDDFGYGVPLDQELIEAGGIIIDASSWMSPSYSSSPWAMWRFPDGSTLFLKGGRLGEARVIE